VNESARCLFVKSRGVDGIYEAARNDIKNLVQKSSTLLGLMLLEDETTGHDRDEQEAEEDAFS
jgi:hypothetical protein